MHNFSIDYLTSVVTSTPEKYPEDDVVAPSVGNSSTAHGDSSGVWSGDSSSHSTPDRPDGNGSLAQALLSTDNVKTPPKTPTGKHIFLKRSSGYLILLMITWISIIPLQNISRKVACSILVIISPWNIFLT